MSAETPDITDPRIARARTMREAGEETADIARACGVTVSRQRPACPATLSSRTRSAPGSAGNALF
ncbi:MAG: hypothetical protein CMH91_13750 [Oceanicaulis sp.]|nr:hypothetical protein [Oceanicaulis sp.]MBG37005.1 hypothetical protein [Oceanicaulis sp.]HBU62018.1 hypothetical protein [Oceanicaulis sp.]